MSVHDWTRVDAGIFHAFHLNWLGRLQDALNNNGNMPPDYYALAEQHAGRFVPDVLTLKEGATRGSTSGIALERSLAIRHVSGHRLVALLEVVSPSNKDRAASVKDFVMKVVTALEYGVHVLFVDLFPPGRHEPHGPSR